MYNDVQLYELSFVAPKRGQTKPQIVFTIATEHFEEIERRTRIVASHMRVHAEQYCPDYPAFSPLSHDLFGNIAFGFGKCGYVQKHDRSVELHVKLSRVHLRASALTMKVLTMALAVPIKNAPGSNRRQQVDLEIRCDPSDLHGYNHAIGGYISDRMLGWLRSQAPGETVSVPVAVIRAMRATWAAVAPENSIRWASECSGRISPDGRFMLECFGNACDIAVYPDGTCGDTNDPYVRFSCHNLDTAAQQATLLAGLAKLCELARESS